MKVHFFPISNTAADLLITGESVKKNTVNSMINKTKDPQQGRIWLKSAKKQSEQSVSSNTKTNIQYTYHSKTVFFLDECIKYQVICKLFTVMRKTLFVGSEKSIGYAPALISKKTQLVKIG